MTSRLKVFHPLDCSSSSVSCETASSGNEVSLEEHPGALPQQGTTESFLACTDNRKEVLLPHLALAQLLDDMLLEN